MHVKPPCEDYSAYTSAHADVLHALWGSMLVALHVYTYQLAIYRPQHEIQMHTMLMLWLYVAEMAGNL